MFSKTVTIIWVAVLAVTLHGAVGKRPYEMEWAGRTRDAYHPLVDFTGAEGWHVECKESEATLESSQEVLLFGLGVAKLTYRATGDTPIVILRPVAPIAIPTAFDTIGCWIYSNNHSYSPDPKTPPVTATALLTASDGSTVRVLIARLQYKEWFWIHRRLTPEQLKVVANGAHLSGIEITGGTNREDRCIYLNSLAIFQERFPPLQFAPRAKRGFSVFPDAPQGANTGAGKLPFPNTPLTIIPQDSSPSVVRVAQHSSGHYLLIRDGEDGRLEVRLPKAGGNWDDLAMRWTDISQEWVTVAEGGGIYFANPSGKLLRPNHEKMEITSDGKSVTYSGIVASGDQESHLNLKVQLIGKSLVFDLQAPGGNIAECRIGTTRGFHEPQRIPIPYYTYNGYANIRERPHLIASGTENNPLFFMAHIDWTQSNASQPFAAPTPATGTLGSNGGTRYLPCTDGKRNPCYERLVFILSPEFHDVLPNIPNPPSPWKHLTGTKLWRAHGASNRQHDAEYWRRIHSLGIRQMVVTDHEVGWRDGNESFTFRTTPAPGKGGDGGQYNYARVMIDELGFLYGPYNNFTDFAPVNGFWDVNLVSRNADFQLQRAWDRCYAPKPARAVEFCERLTPIIQNKFNFNTAYCDVHTAVAPWTRVDYDSRVPGAGSFAPVFYSFGEIMLIQKQNWQGPVYSEGNNHFPYCGLTDGNYGQDQGYRPAENPWLVDFDLLRMHDLCCNFGMGNLDMFYPAKSQPADANLAMDRFLAATIAFGHPGFLLSGRAGELRSYYMLQALAARYTQVSTEEIRYCDAQGQLHPTSAALANGCYRRSQVVTRYANGTLTAANGSLTEHMQVNVDGTLIDLPPNGYWGRSEDNKVKVFASEMNGHRVDFSSAPGYLYADGRGQFTHFGSAATDGVAIILPHTSNLAEIITWQAKEAAFALGFESVNGFDEKGQHLGPAQVRTARGMSYIQPMKGAFKYRAQYTSTLPADKLKCTLREVTPGSRVVVEGSAKHEVVIPASAKPGERIWHNFEESWIDFTVIPPLAIDARVEGQQLIMNLLSASQEPLQSTVVCGNRMIGTTLKPATDTPVIITLENTELEQPAIDLAIKLHLAESTIELQKQLTKHKVESEYALGEITETGTALRNKTEQPLDNKNGAGVDKRAITCGGVLKYNAIFMHPPYLGGTGYTYASFNLKLPPEPLLLQALVGKQDGSDLGDGILYKLLISNSKAQDTRQELLTKHVADHNWHPIEADLSTWAGQEVTLWLITDVGPANNSSGDWGAWAELSLEPLTPKYEWR